MIRYVLAVVLAVALVGASLPAIEAAGANRTEDELTRFGARLEREVADLRTRSDPVEQGTSGGRRLVSLSIPRRSLTAARVRFVELCPAPESRATFRYAIGTRPAVSRPLDADLRFPNGGVRFVEPGRHVLELRYRTDGDGQRGTGAVVATVPESSSTGTGPSAACDSSTASARTTDDGVDAKRPSGPPPAWPNAT